MALALLSGFAGATGGYLAKIGFDIDSTAVPWLMSMVCGVDSTERGLGGGMGYGLSTQACASVGFVVRGLIIGASFAASGMGIAAFVTAMGKSSSVAVSVLATGSNIVCSGAYAVLMGETITTAYCAGSVLVVLGMSLISFSQGGVGVDTAVLLGKMDKISPRVSIASTSSSSTGGEGAGTLLTPSKTDSVSRRGTAAACSAR